MNSSGWLAQPENRIERVLVWLLRLVLLLFASMALLGGDAGRSLALAVILVVHVLMYWAAAPERAPVLRPWLLILTDTGLAAFAFLLSEGTAEQSMLLGSIVVAAVAVRLGLWQALAVNTGLWLLFTWPLIQPWLWQGGEFSTRILITLILSWAVTWGANHLASVEAGRNETVRDLSVRLRSASTVQEATLAIASTLELEKVFDLLLTSAAELVGARAGSLWLRDGVSGPLLCRAAAPDSANLVGRRLPHGDSVVRAAIEMGEAQLVTGSRLDSVPGSRATVVSKADGGSVLCVPLFRRGQAIGALEVADNVNGTPFGAEDLELLTGFAAQAAVVLENAFLSESTDEALNKRVEELIAIEEIDRELGATLDSDRILDLVLQRAVEACSATSGLIGILSPDGKEADALRWRGGEPNLMLGPSTDAGAVEHNVVGEALSTGQTALVSDVVQATEYRPTSETTRSEVAVPISYEGQTIGVLVLLSDRAQAFRPGDIRFVEHMTDHAGIAIEKARLFQAQQRQLQELGVLVETSTAISSSLELDDVLSTVARHVAYALGVTSCSISDWDPARSAVTTLVAETVDADPRASLTTADIGRSYALAQFPATAKVLRDRVPLVVQASDPVADLAERLLLEEMGQESALMLPLVTHDRVVGLLELYESHYREFSDEDIRLCQALASQAAVAIDNARLYEETDERLRSRVDELVALQRTTQELNATLERDHILGLVLELAVQTTRATHGFVMLVDEETGRFVLRTAHGYSPDDEAAIERLLLDPRGDSLVLRVVQSGQSRIVDDAGQEDSVTCVREDTRSALAVPILYQDAVVGLINLRHTELGAFDGEALRFVRALAEQAATAIGNAMRFEEQVRVNSALRQRTEQLDGLLAVSQKLRTDVPLEDVLEEVAYAVQETVGFNIVLVSVVEDSRASRPMLQRVAAAGLPLEVFEEARRIRQPSERYERILKEEYRQGLCYFFPYQKQDDWGAELHTMVPMAETEGWQEGQWHPRDMLLAPLRGAGGRLLGHISVDEPRDGLRPSRRTLEVLAIFANQAAIAVENAHLYSDAHRRAENLALINKVGQTLAQLVEPEQVLSTVVDSVGLLLKCETAAVFLPDPDDSEFAAAASYGASLASLVELRFAPGEGLVGAVASTGETLVVPDTDQDSRYVPGPVPVGSMILVPIGAGSEITGVLTAGRSQKHALTDSDRLLLTTLADQLSAALKSTRLLTSTQQAALRLASLNEIGRRVAAQLELKDMLETTVNSVHEYLGYPRVGVFLVDEASSELYVAAANRTFQAIIPSDYRQRVGEGLIGAVAASGETLVMNDGLADEQSAQAAGWSSPSSVSVPIRAAGRVIGVLQVEAEQRGRFSGDDAAALEIAADHLATSIENARLFLQIQRRVAELATVNEIGRAISSALDTDRLAELIYEQVSNLLDARSFHLALHDPDSELIQIEFLVERGQRQPSPIALQPGHGLTSYLVQTGEPLLLTHGTEQFLEDHGLQAGREIASSWLGVPMIAKDRVIGAITVQSFNRRDAFDAAHLELLTIIAGQAAVAYQNAVLFQEGQQRIEQLNVLNEVAHAISSTLELDELLQVVYQQVTRLVDADNFFIALYDEDKGEITFPFAVDPENREDWHPREKGEGLTGTIIDTGRPILLKAGAAGLYQEADRVVDAGVCRSWLGVPMIAEDKVLGVIAVQDYEREYLYNEDHLNVLSTVAAQAAVAVRNAQLYRQIIGFSSDQEEMVRERTQDLARALDELTIERDRVETLYRITSEVGASLELDRVLQRALRLLADALGLEHGTILLFDQRTGDLSLRATLDADRSLPRDGKPTSWKLGVGLAGWVMEHRTSVLVDDINEDSRWVHRPGKELRVRSVVAAPLSLGGGDILGVLTLGHPSVGYFTKEHLQLVSAATSQIAMAVNNSDLYAFITDQADQLGTALQAQQEEAAKNRAVLESIADGVLVLDHNGRVLLVNPATEDLLGFAGLALQGQHFRHMLGLGEMAHQRELAQALYSELLDRLDPRGGEAQRQEGSVRLQAGPTTLAVTIAPLIVAPGGAPGLVAALRDISREAEVERLKNEFISTVSHELRTPMTSIKGYTDLLFLGMAGGLTDAQRDFLKIIKANADRLTALVNDILDISRMETGRMRLTIESLDLGQLITQVVISFQEQFREKSLTLEWDEAEDLPMVRGDAARVTQVLGNLLANAWQYTAEGGRVSISVRPTDRFLRVDITDSGIGIAPEDVGRIFDRFYRADHPVVQEAGGTGLGLSIVKMFVEMLGGEISVTSELGVGSNFGFTLPLASVDLPALIPHLEGAELVPGSNRRPKILVVEDDHDLAILLRRQLEEEGYQVLLAGTGEDALWLAREARPQLITLDLMLPDMDGFAVLEDLKQNPLTLGIPVVIVSVLTETEKGYALGAVDYVVKPFEEEQLMEVVRDAFHQMEQERPLRLVVADDDTELLSMMRKVLELHGYQVWTALSGAEAIACVEECRPDLILLDIEMPGMDGYEVVRQLQANASTQTIPVILITARPIGKERDRVQVLGTHVTRYLTKPLSMEILIREIKKAVSIETTA